MSDRTIRPGDPGGERPVQFLAASERPRDLASILHPWTCAQDHPDTDGGWLCRRAAADVEFRLASPAARRNRCGRSPAASRPEGLTPERLFAAIYPALLADPSLWPTYDPSKPGGYRGGPFDMDGRTFAQELAIRTYLHLSDTGDTP